MCCKLTEKNRTSFQKRTISDSAMKLFHNPFSRRLNEIARATAFPIEYASSKVSYMSIYFVRLVFLVGRRIWRDQCPRQAAALAFQTMLSLVPLLVVAVSVTSTLAIDSYENDLILFLEAHLLPESASAMGSYVLQLANDIRPSTLGVVGGASLVFIAMTLLFTVEQVVNEIFRRTHARRIWVRVPLTLMVLAGAPLAFGLSLYFTGELFKDSGVLNALVPLFFTIVALFLCYWLLPHTKIRMGYSVISATLAGIVFEVTKVGFALYATHLGATLSYVYGAFAILPLFMLWIYLAWIIFLFGAEFNAALHEVKWHDRFKVD